jgi:acetyl-CoA carboxylase biotin carboxyl carrier protein
MSDRPEDTDDQAADPAAKPNPPEPTMSAETASLLSLIDKLGSLLERSDLVELEVESGDTGIVLRKPAALAQPMTSIAMPVAAAGDRPAGSESATQSGGPAAEAAPSSSARFVKAPLTGIFYAASSPTSPPYVTPGQKIAVGHVIGLIEAMKLFNEIKSDQAGTVVRVVAETGKLVKAKQPLIELES